MTIPMLVPLLGGPPGAHLGAHGGPPFFLLPVLAAAGLALVLFIIAAPLLLARRGRLGPPPWVTARMQAPEQAARRILAERFAGGEISGEEFLERASVLNWTPGVAPAPPGKRKRRKR